MKQNIFSYPARNRGLTLVELLVATTVGLFLMGGVVAVMIDNKDNFVFEQEVAVLQENARFIDDELIHEIRMAGFVGCSDEAVYTNTLGEVSAGIASVRDEDWMNSEFGVQGYEYSTASSLPAFTDIKADTDVLIINRGDPYGSADVLSHSPTTAVITTDGAHDFVSDDILLISDSTCSNVAVFQASAAGGASISHDTGGRNCRRALSSNSDGTEGYNCDDPPPVGSAGMAYSQWSTLMKYKTSAYYVSDSDITGLPTLFRVARVSGGDLDTQELISGVEDFQVLYGVAGPDRRIDRYLSADFVRALGTRAWEQIISVRVTIIMKSQREVMPVAADVDLGGGYDATTYGFLDDTRYAFQKVTVSGGIRNSNIRNISEP